MLFHARLTLCGKWSNKVLVCFITDTLGTPQSLTPISVITYSGHDLSERFVSSVISACVDTETQQHTLFRLAGVIYLARWLDIPHYTLIVH